MSQIASDFNPKTSITNWLNSLWKFSRPHTIIGTSLSVLALYLIAIANSPSQLGTQWQQLLETLVACWCGNVYIVGLNQLEDIAIDQINKPHLPLAAGTFSRRVGSIIVAVTGILAILLAVYGGKWLLLTVATSIVIGTAYSLPPIRLKRSPFLAALCIFTVRGVIVNLGLFAHFAEKLGGFERITPTVWVLTGFVVVFTVAIALFKDVPDTEGDKQYKIQTFTLLVGKQTIFNWVQIIITICYGAMIVAAWLWLAREINLWFLTITHGCLLLLLWWRSQGVDLDQKMAIASFYQFIWKLFFLEYILFPFACLWK